MIYDIYFRILKFNYCTIFIILIIKITTLDIKKIKVVFSDNIRYQHVSNIQLSWLKYFMVLSQIFLIINV